MSRAHVSSPEFSLRQLHYIVSVAELGGFRKAADACHVSQPALSAQIALAERQLGVQIFERDRRGVRPSPHAADVIEHARRVLTVAGELQDLARRLADPLKGTLRLGIIPTIGPYLLPDITPAIRTGFPHLSLQWREQRTDDLVRLLRHGALDGILVAREAALGELAWLDLGHDPFVIAAAPSHPIVRGLAPATTEMLSQARVLLLDDGHCFRDQALNVCAKAGAIEDSFRATSLGTLVQMVSASDCVTVLPSLALAVENRRSQLRVRPFEQPGPARTLGFAWRPGSAMGRTLEKLAEVMRPLLNKDATAPTVTKPRASKRPTRPSWSSRLRALRDNRPS